MLQAEPTPPPPVAVAYAQPAGPIEQDQALRMTRPKPCPTSGDGDIVVCARRNDEQYRLHPIVRPPIARNILHKPLRVTLAPGLTFGLQPGGGIGLRAKFGPGAKGSDKQE